MTFARDLLDFGVSIIFENELFRTSMGISNRIMVSSYSPPLEDISSNSMRNLLLYLFILDLETMRFQRAILESQSLPFFCLLQRCWFCLL
jgi:hypothetical protein